MTKPDRRAVLWDVGGTLVDVACTLPELVRHRLTCCGIDHSGLSDIHIERTYAEFIGNERQWLTIERERAAERDWLASLLEDLSLDRETMDETFAAMPRYFDLLRPVPGLMALLSELRGRGLPMAVVSNWPPSLPEFLDHHGLTCYFDSIVYSAQDGIHKPDRRIFQRALDAIGATAEQAVFIGDNPESDIQPARAMGMRAIHFEPRRTCPSRDADDVRTLRGLLWGMLGP
jgi:HAD superfamily hydrolase (TIGR01509 family)